MIDQKEYTYSPVLKTQDEASLPTEMLTFLKNLPHAAFIKSMDGVCIFTNPTLQALLLDVDDLIAANMDANLFNHALVLETEQAVRASGSTVANAEIKVSVAEDASWVFKLDCMPLHNADADFIGTVGILRDFTEPYYQAQQLAESANLMQAVLDHLPVRVFWKDKELNYLGCNRIFATDVGFETPEQLIGNDDFNTCMTHEEAFLCRGGDAEVYKSQIPIIGAEEVIGGDNKRWIRVSKVPLHSSTNEPLGILGMYEDISEQKSAQIELENAFRRERELNELKSRFISTVSHEFRNPLAAIQISADLLLHLGDSANVGAREKRLSAILNQITRMKRLMESVLFIGREDIQDTDRKYEAVNMATLTKDAMDASDDPQRIELTYAGSQRPVIGLPLHLTQIMQNLLSNALLYSEEQVKCHLEWQSDTLIVEVSDQGIGIPKKDRAHIFESFYRSANAGSIQGNGLGLYIVERAVALHNGVIDLQSTLNESTVIRVELPLKPQPLAVDAAS